VAAAYLETDEAYPEFKAGPLRFARYCNGVILPHEGRVHQTNKRGPRPRGCRRAILAWAELNNVGWTHNTQSAAIENVM